MKHRDSTIRYIKFDQGRRVRPKTENHMSFSSKHTNGKRPYKITASRDVTLNYDKRAKDEDGNFVGYTASQKYILENFCTSCYCELKPRDKFPIITLKTEREPLLKVYDTREEWLKAEPETAERIQRYCTIYSIEENEILCKKVEPKSIWQRIKHTFTRALGLFTSNQKNTKTPFTL